MAKHREERDVRRKVGECPACKYPLFADVRLVTELSPAEWSDSLPSPHAHVGVRITGMTFGHACGVFLT